MTKCCVRKISTINHSRVMMVVGLPNASVVRFDICINNDTVEKVISEYKRDVLDEFPDHEQYLKEIEGVLHQRWPKKFGRFIVY